MKNKFMSMLVCFNNIADDALIQSVLIKLYKIIKLRRKGHEKIYIISKHCNSNFSY